MSDVYRTRLPSEMEVWRRYVDMIYTVDMVYTSGMVQAVNMVYTIDMGDEGDHYGKETWNT